MASPELIPLSAADIGPIERAAVDRVLASGRLSLGEELLAFEAEFAARHGVQGAVALSSGTAALHAGLLALGICAGDEVITTPYSFIASANAIRYTGARPVFVDIDAQTLNLDPAKLAAALSPRTKAILVVHVFGLPAAMREILAFARQHHLLVIEDACEAIGASYRGQPIGTFGDVAAFGFYPNKVITTGEGGMLLAKDPQVLDTVRALRNQGRDPKLGWADHAHLGFNYRMPELSAALGRAQLARLDQLLSARAAVAAAYLTGLAQRQELILPLTSDDIANVSWFVFVLRLAPPATLADREALRAQLMDAGIATGRYFAPIHLQPCYQQPAATDRSSAKGAFPKAEQAGDTCLALPFSSLHLPHVPKVLAALHRALDRLPH